MQATPNFLRTASAEHVNLRHPIPDTQTPPSKTTGIPYNIERLEQSAEELSQGGSDIGEEIRKLQEEQRRSDSRRSSIASHDSFYNFRSYSGIRSRNASTSSHANSYLDINNQARHGGYSPSGYVGSPSVSLHSGSWTNVALHRVGSNSRRPEPVQEGRPLDSPVVSPSAPSHQHSLSHSASQRSQKKRAAMEHGSPYIQEEAEGVNGQTSRSHRNSQDSSERLPRLEDLPEDDYRPATPPDRPPTADTYRQARSLFHDFDGVHYAPSLSEFVRLDADGHETERIPTHMIRNSSLEEELQNTPRAARPKSYAHPLPKEGMTYYPAPVPRLLNLPKRLSKLPAPNIVSQRRSKVISQTVHQPQQRASWIPPMDFEEESEPLERQTSEAIENEDDHDTQGSSPRQASFSAKARQNRQSQATLSGYRPVSKLTQRHSMGNLHNVPPQLRASMFFQQPSVQHNVRIQSDSAVATLDSILAASVYAPVSKYSYNPFAGKSLDEYDTGESLNKRHTMALPLVGSAKNNASQMEQAAQDAKNETQRKSMITMPTGQIASEHPRASRRSSVISMLTDFGPSEGKKLKKRNSRMSLGSDFDMVVDHDKRESNGTAIRDRKAGSTNNEDVSFDSELADNAKGVLGVDEDEDPDMGPVFAAPTTLLAELQLRKAQQKTRNRTAADGFPNGMHSTLLELDAVAQIEKRKRQAHKVALAWEDPATIKPDDADEDEDVPLGILYSGGQAPAARRGQPEQHDRNRPIGLIEQRQLEDNEPLSSRRNRILGIRPTRVPQDEVRPDEDEDMPLRERLQRLKQKDTLDDTRNTGSFSDELLSQFGGLQSQQTDRSADVVNHEETPAEEETLGQRRARLQKERADLANVSDSANVESTDSARPAVRRSSSSFANLLATNPIGQSENRRVPSGPTPGTLLSASEQMQQENKKKLRNQNARTSSYQMKRPQLQQMQSSQTIGAFGISSPGYGTGLATSMSTPGLNMGAYQPNYFAGTMLPQQMTMTSNSQLL